MRLVIAGAGAVGTHLAKLFAREHHDVVLIDNSQKRLALVANYVDILTIEGSAMDIDKLEEAGIKAADLFVGVTPQESINMMCCILAKKLGAKKTVARVESNRYTTKENRDFFKGIGIDSLVYPEGLVGKEINHLIERPWLRQWWEVQDGQLVVLGVKIRKGSGLVDQPLYTLMKQDAPLHVTAIKRAGETIIPHGNDILRPGDLAFIMTTANHIEYVRTLIGKANSPEAKNVFYMGASDSALCSINTLPSHIHGKLFDIDAARIDEITTRIRNNHIMPHVGDARDVDVLIDENIKDHQVFIAATDNSETNILACMAVKGLGIGKTIAMVENSEYIALAESLDIGSIINKKTFAAGQIYRMMLRSDVESVKSLNIAAAEVAEYHVKEGSLVTKKPVKELGFPPYASIGGFVRRGKGHFVNGETVFMPEDTVVVFCLEGYLKKLERFFK